MSLCVCAAVLLGRPGTLAAQLREVRGVFGVRYDRLGVSGASADSRVLGQLRLEAFGHVVSPDVATFGFLAESRNGIVTAPPQYGLIVIGTEARISQADLRFEVAPRGRLTGGGDASLARIQNLGSSAPTYQRSLGVRLAYQGSPRLPAVGLGYRMGSIGAASAFGGGATYRMATLDVAKSGDRSSVSASLRADVRPPAVAGGDQGSVNGTVSGTMQLAEATNFAVSASYNDARTFYTARTGTLSATMWRRPVNGSSLTGGMTSEFADVGSLRGRSVGLRLDGTQPVLPRLRIGGAGAVTRLDVTNAAGDSGGVDIAASATLRLETNLPAAGGQDALVAAYAGYGRSRSEDPSRPRTLESLLYGSSLNIPFARNRWLALGLGATVGGQEPIGEGVRSNAVSVSQTIGVTLPRLQWAVTGVWVRSDARGLLLTQQGAQTTASLLGGSTRASVTTSLTMQPVSRVSANVNAVYDREVRPFRGSAFTAMGRLAYLLGYETEVGADAEVYQYATVAASDLASYGVFLVRRFRSLEMRLDVRVNRALSGDLPTRTYVAAYVTRAFQARFR